jgi:hypothetical protein
LAPPPTADTQVNSITCTVLSQSGSVFARGLSWNASGKGRTFFLCRNLGITMSRRAVRVFFGALAMATAAIFAAPASAVVYDSGFDPSDLFGSGLFDFEGDCVHEGSYVLFVNDPTMSTCTVTLLSGSATLFSSTDIVFAPPPSTNIFDIVVTNGILTGMDTGFIGPTFGTGESPGPWYLQWTQTPPLTLVAQDPVSIYGQTCVDDVCNPNTVSTAEALNVTFALVPEPATLGLILGGVGAAWLARRRKAAT